MFVGSPKDNNYFSTLEKLGLFEMVEVRFNENVNKLQETLLHKSKDNDYFEQLLKVLVNYGLVFLNIPNSSPDDLLSFCASSLYETGYHPRKNSTRFFDKDISSILLKLDNHDKFIAKGNINALLTEHRGYYLKKFSYDHKSGYYLLRHGIKFNKDEEEFLHFS